MKKIKGLLFALVGIFVFALAMVKVNAADTEDVVTKATINAAEVTQDGITFTSTPLKTGLTAITGTSLIDGTQKSYDTGTKLNSSGTLTFTTQYAWSARILFSSGTASQTVHTNNGTVSVVTPNGANTLGEIAIVGGTAGPVTITRGGSKEMWIFEVVLTQTKKLNATYCDVYFHDIDGNPGTPVPVEQGTKATAATAAPVLGKKFVKWTTDGSTEFDFNTVINGETHLYPMYEDVDLSATDSNALSRNYLASVLGVLPSMPTIDERTALPSTNYALAKGAGFMNNDTKKFEGETEAVLYGINTNGRLNNEAGVWTNAIEFLAPSAGTFTIYGRSGNSSARAVSITTDNTNFITSEAVGQDNIVLITMNIEQGGTYYIGCQDGGFKFYSIEFEAAPEPSSTFHFSSGYNDEGVELVRYILAVENMTEDDLVAELSNLKVVLTGEGLGADGFDITNLFQIANRITSKGENLTAETLGGGSYECGVKANTLYAVAVVAVSNDGVNLAEQYKDKVITLHVYKKGATEGTWDEVPGITVNYTVLGAQQA